MSMTTGKHADRVLTKKADAALTLHNLLVKPGTDADHIAVVAAADEEPLGVCTDAPDVAEYPASVALLVTATVLGPCAEGAGLAVCPESATTEAITVDAEALVAAGAPATEEEPQEDDLRGH